MWEVPFPLACGQGRISGRRFSPPKKLLFEWREATTGNTSVFADYILRLFYRLNGVSKSAYTKFSLTRGGQGSTVNILIFFFHSYLVGIIVRHTSFNLVVSRLSIISLRAQLAKMKGVWNLLEVKR